MADYVINPLTLNDPKIDPKVKYYLNKIVKYKKDKQSGFLCQGEYRFSEDDKTITVELSHNMILRGRNSKVGDRLEVLEHSKFTHGGYGRLYRSLGVVMPELDYSFKKKAEDKSRICKAIPYNPKILSTKERIEAESAFTKRNPLLHSKGVVFDEPFGGYLVMRKLGTMDLLDFQETYDKYYLKLNLKQRLQLIYNILKAVKEQVYDLGLIHNDLKLDNMLIDTSDLNNIKVFIIDYAFAQERENLRVSNSMFGTPGYIAPEIIQNFNRSPISDVYATGVTIAMLLGELIAYCTSSNASYDTVLKFQETLSFPNLLKNITAPVNIQIKVDEFMKRITAFNFMERFGITDAMAYWKKVMDLNERNERDNKFQSTKNFTPTYSATSAQWFLNKPKPPRTPSWNTGITQFNHQPVERKFSVA